jgi:hypothetical protein
MCERWALPQHSCKTISSDPVVNQFGEDGVLQQCPALASLSNNSTLKTAEQGAQVLRNVGQRRGSYTSS